MIQREIQRDREKYRDIKGDRERNRDKVGDGERYQKGQIYNFLFNFLLKDL